MLSNVHDSVMTERASSRAANRRDPQRGEFAVHRHERASRHRAVSIRIDCSAAAVEFFVEPKQARTPCVRKMF
jgi:hypothetical protein